MKRRHRRPILDIDGEHSNSPIRHFQDKYRQPSNVPSEENGSSKNPLKGLLGYNSDSETDDMHQPSNKLDDKVNDFLKEIQSIASENATSGSKEHIPGKVYSAEPEMSWQECFDESTGYPYYWNMKSNQVTWEMPPEYRLWKEKSQMSQQNLQMSHWPGVAGNSYPKPQTEIPEGMIPKEVVARNRNRQAGIQQSRVPINENQPTSSIPPHLRDDDSDDGKIEMITSFGNEESEESESDNEGKFSDSKSKKIQRKPSEYSSREKKSEVKPASKQVQIGPCLPPKMIEKIKSKVAKHKSMSVDIENFLSTRLKHKTESVSKESEKSEIGDEDDILRRLKTQAKLLQSMGKSANSSESSQKTSSRGESPDLELSRQKRAEEKPQLNKEFKLSLVPGYEDDSDNEEEAPPVTEIKPLFPIVEYQSDKSLPSVSNDGIIKKVETREIDSGSIRIFEYKSIESEKTDTASTEIREPNNGIDSPDSSELESRGSQPGQDLVKVNKFLENLETPTKAFQRKKRIAFDVLPNRPKVPETQDVPNVEELQTSTVTEGERVGFGFQKEKEEVTSNDSTEAKSSEIAAKPEKELIDFVKGETLNNTVKLKEEIKSIPAAENKEFKYLTEMISEKLKFLAEGCQMVSAVQVMAIQLQTLLEAWEAGDLKQTYLHQWLTMTGRELSRLEQTAAPPGWECQWDRSHKRYYYRNAATGAAQWTYPEMDVTGGSEEMELCTTPPPEQEEPAIIERDVESSKKNSTTEEEERKLAQEVEDLTSKSIQESEIKVPPPPTISSPSPPPPPRICAEDLKKGKKRRYNHEKDSENKKEKLEQVTSANSAQTAATIETPQTLKSIEPLPPGVDPPEIPYALPATVLESGVLYAASPHQNNPIYAATMGSAILSHHTALMQGQLLHYPAYHIHNPALMAAATRLGPEGVQFMMTDYSQIYGTNQVIAKPPVKAQRESLGSAIDSFYNDIASIENSKVEVEAVKQEISHPESVSSPVPQIQLEESQSSASDVSKDKKKKKTKLGLGKKQKEMSSMVAKWQRVQHNY